MVQQQEGKCTPPGRWRAVSATGGASGHGKPRPYIRKGLLRCRFPCDNHRVAQTCICTDFRNCSSQRPSFFRSASYRAHLGEPCLLQAFRAQPKGLASTSQGPSTRLPCSCRSSRKLQFQPERSQICNAQLQIDGASYRAYLDEPCLLQAF